MVARIRSSVRTTISSISVKPRVLEREAGSLKFEIGNLKFARGHAHPSAQGRPLKANSWFPVSNLELLPITVLGPIQGGPIALGINIKNVLAAPAPRVRIILHRAHPPIGCVRHGVDRYLAKELVLRRSSSLQRDTIDERLKVRRITKGVYLDRHHPPVSKVLVVVNGFAHSP